MPADPSTLVGRTWGSLSAEERASLPQGTSLFDPETGSTLERYGDRGDWYLAGTSYCGDEPADFFIVESVPQ